MRGVDAELLDVDPTSADDLAAGANFAVVTLAGALDVFTDPSEVPGARPWSQLRADAIEVRLGELTLLVAGRDDLVAMKAAAGRAKDRDDIAALTDAGILQHERDLGEPSQKRELRPRTDRRALEPPSWER